MEDGVYGVTLSKGVNELGWEKIISLLTSTQNLQLWTYITNHRSINGTCNVFYPTEIPGVFTLQLSWGSWNSFYVQQCLKIIVLIRFASRSCLSVSMVHILWVGRLALVKGRMESNLPHKNIWEEPASKLGLPPLLFLSSVCHCWPSQVQGENMNKTSYLVFWLEWHCPIQLWTMWMSWSRACNSNSLLFLILRMFWTGSP